MPIPRLTDHLVVRLRRSLPTVPTKWLAQILCRSGLHANHLVSDTGESPLYFVCTRCFQRSAKQRPGENCPINNIWLQGGPWNSR